MRVLSCSKAKQVTSLCQAPFNQAVCSGENQIRLRPRVGRAADSDDKSARTNVAVQFGVLCARPAILTARTRFKVHFLRLDM